MLFVLIIGTYFELGRKINFFFGSTSVYNKGFMVTITFIFEKTFRWMDTNFKNKLLL